MAVLCYAPNALIGDALKPAASGSVVTSRSTFRTPRSSIAPPQPRISEYPIPYYYEFYTGHGNYLWGTQLPTIPGVEGHVYVRTSYNYWTHGKRKLHDLARKVVVVDNLQEWEVVPHRPRFVTASGDQCACSATDTSVSVRGDDLFDEQVWPLLPDWYNGPGDNRQAFDEILRRIEQDHQ